MNATAKRMTAHADDDDIFEALVRDSRVERREYADFIEACAKAEDKANFETPIIVQMKKMNSVEAYHFGRLMAKMEDWRDYDYNDDGYGFTCYLNRLLDKSPIRLDQQSLNDICEIFANDVNEETTMTNCGMVVVGQHPFALVLMIDGDNVIDPRQGNKIQNQTYQKWLKEWKEEHTEPKGGWFRKIEVDGKKYLRHSKSFIVYDYLEYVKNGEEVVVGKWNSETKTIDFV